MIVLRKAVLDKAESYNLSLEALFHEHGRQSALIDWQRHGHGEFRPCSMRLEHSGYSSYGDCPAA